MSTIWAPVFVAIAGNSAIPARPSSWRQDDRSASANSAAVPAAAKRGPLAAAKRGWHALTAQSVG
jgi:hypothetical protein